MKQMYAYLISPKNAEFCALEVRGDKERVSHDRVQQGRWISSANQVRKKP